MHSGASRWNSSWEMGEMGYCAHNSVATGYLKSNAPLWLAHYLGANYFWPIRSFETKSRVCTKPENHKRHQGQIGKGCLPVIFLLRTVRQSKVIIWRKPKVDILGECGFSFWEKRTLQCTISCFKDGSELRPSWLILFNFGWVDIFYAQFWWSSHKQIAKCAQLFSNNFSKHTTH